MTLGTGTRPTPLRCGAPVQSGLRIDCFRGRGRMTAVVTAVMTAVMTAVTTTTVTTVWVGHIFLFGAHHHCGCTPHRSSVCKGGRNCLFLFLGHLLKWFPREVRGAGAPQETQGRFSIYIYIYVYSKKDMPSSDNTTRTLTTLHGLGQHYVNSDNTP